MFKKITFSLFACCALFFCANTSNIFGQPQIAPEHRMAADAYRQAARNCPGRAACYEQYAKYEECKGRQLATGSNERCAQPTCSQVTPACTAASSGGYSNGSSGTSASSSYPSVNRVQEVTNALMPLANLFEQLFAKRAEAKARKRAQMAANKPATTSPPAAQLSAKEQLYTNFIACYKETDPVRKDACYKLADEYLDKYGTDNDEYSNFVKRRYDLYEKDLAYRQLMPIINTFNESIKDVKTVNVDEAFSSGKSILDVNPDLIDVPIVLASIGFDNASAQTPNDRYNNDAINYAKLTIQKLEQGQSSTTGVFGAYAYSYKTSQFTDGKSNTLGWMNYIIGYIMYQRLGMKREALPFLYRATQFNSAVKTHPELYRTIGKWYVDEVIRLDKDRVAKIEAAGNQDTEETKRLLSMEMVYTERAIDAYARAYYVTEDNPSNQTYKEGLFKRAQELYGIRFNKDMSGFQAYMSNVMNNPFIDPSSVVR